MDSDMIDKVKDASPPPEWFAKVAVAILGGVAKLAWEVLGGKKHPFWHFMLRSVVSSFIGVVCYHIMPKGSELGFAMTGLLAWMGADGITLLVEMIKSRRQP